MLTIEMEQLIITDRAGVWNKYRKTESDIENYVEMINEWAGKQAHLPPIPRYKIELFLVGCKYCVEKTKRVLNTHYTIRNLIPELFDNWDPLSPEIQTQLKSSRTFMLRHLTPDLSRVYIGRIIDDNPELYNAWELWKQTLLNIELVAPIEYSASQIIIIDLKGITINHIFKNTPVILRKFYTAIIEAYCARLAGIHLINAHVSLSGIMSIVKLIVKPKIYERIHIHSNIESLYKFIPREILPKDYGGDQQNSLEISEQWVRQWMNSRDLFLNEMRTKADEKQVTDSPVDDEMFGSVHGSFRTLTVD